MSWELALRWTEVALAVTVLQRAAEHLGRPHDRDRWLFGAQAALAALLLFGLVPAAACAGLWLLLCLQLWRYQGPYNGGADKMVFLVTTCLTVAQLAPTRDVAELAMAYLAVQLVLSYFVSGWIKVIHADWRRGRALQDVFAFSAYPVSEATRAWADRPRLLFFASRAVIGFELLFPLALVAQATLVIALCVALAFHLSNAVLLGLNRFVWAWLAAYPSVLWFQGRLIG